MCRVSTSVVHGLPKPMRRVRLPYPAPKEKVPVRVPFFSVKKIALLKLIERGIPSHLAHTKCIGNTAIKSIPLRMKIYPSKFTI